MTAGPGRGTEERQPSQQGSVDPWKDAMPAQAKAGSLRGCQRGNSAAMAVLRSSLQGSAMQGEPSKLLVSQLALRHHPAACLSLMPSCVRCSPAPWTCRTCAV